MEGEHGNTSGTEPTLEVKRTRPPTYSAPDCTPISYDKKFESQKPHECFLRYDEFFRQDINNDEKRDIFHFSKNEKNELDFENNPFATWRNGKVWTGRWIGKVTYTPAGRKSSVTLEVRPRFGNPSVFAMIEEAFSCNIVRNIGGLNSAQDVESLMKLIVPFVWSQKIADANLYGVPRNTVDVFYKGVTIKGRLDVRKSIIPLFRQKEVVSKRREKQIDETIAQIVLQAYRKLGKQADRKFVQQDNATEAIRDFETANYPLRRVTENEYQHIRYKPIYAQYKDVVDFSWQILKSSFSESDGSKNSFTGFLDMGEIWEIYLRSLLRRKFPDWTVSSPEVKTYHGAFWERNIIPDIVLEKGDKVAIFDAKWKRMKGEKREVKLSDLDRGDFFQIHSYIAYYKAIGKEVVAGGLLYPLDNEFPVGKDNTRASLWGKDNGTKFIVDGICLADSDKLEDYTKYKEEISSRTEKFIERIKGYLGEARADLKALATD